MEGGTGRLIHIQLWDDIQPLGSAMHVLVQNCIIWRKSHAFHFVESFSELHLHFVDLLGVRLLRLSEIKVVDVLTVETFHPFRNNQSPVE